MGFVLEEFFSVWHWSSSKVACVRGIQGKKKDQLSQIGIVMQASALTPE